MQHAGTQHPGHFRAMTPPVAGAIFAVTLAFMLLFPFVRLTLSNPGKDELLAAMKGHVLAETQLIGTYQKIK